MTNRVVNTISGRLSLRAPQRQSLEALAIAATPDILNPKRDVEVLLEVLKSEFPKLSDFEREFPSLCFALATGVGKTRLMGAFISYLHLAHGISNFFVLAPNLTIYNKLIADFTPNTPKYVFKGIAEFAVNSPKIITGDDYEVKGRALDAFTSVSINIFNISKINSEVRGGKSPRIKRLSEYLGDSYFNYLAQLPDLVLLMDESHRYRADAGVRALNELKPLLGLELTATPFTESSKGPVPFKNVVVDYPLAKAMDDGFVKEPAVVTQRNFDVSQHTKEEVERIKLMDGIRLHEMTKVELLTFAHENDVVLVKPFMLVIARDTTHAAQLVGLMESSAFFDGRYQGKIIQVDSSKSGAAEEEMITRLLAVESHDEPTEVVIHVNMLKEGWDVTNLYTIVPLRAANARTLIEQSIGRGLRLPYGKRTGVIAVDRLNIVAHDRFQEIVDEANNPENPLRMQQVILDAPSDEEKAESVTVGSNLDDLINGKTGGMVYQGGNNPPVFSGVAETTVAQFAIAELNKLQHNPGTVATSKALLHSVQPYRDTVSDKGKIKQMLFGSFSKCLYPVQKFDSDTERRFAVILERDAQKWFKPAKGQFKIFYKDGVEHPEYVPDFVAETEDCVLMVETKSQAEMADSKVQAKTDAAVKWCVNAGDYLLKNGGKAWKYLLIPHDEVKENFQLRDYMRKFERL